MYSLLLGLTGMFINRFHGNHSFVETSEVCEMIKNVSVIFF